MSVSPIEKLIDHALPELKVALEEYRAVAVPHCDPVQSQMLGELTRRIHDTEFLLVNIARLEQRAPSRALTEIFSVASRDGNTEVMSKQADSERDAMRLFTETFYWVSHKALAVAVAKQGNYPKRLPGLPQAIRAPGVTSIRNSFIEHPYVFSETFSLGGMWLGPVLNGGVGRAKQDGPEIIDLGLYSNAIEWCQQMTGALASGRQELANLS